MKETIYSEDYLSEKDFEQVLSACKFAFYELDMNILDEGINVYGDYFLKADEKFTFFRNTKEIKEFIVQLEKDNKGTKLTIFVDYGHAFGPWLKIHGTNLGKKFINTVKIAENKFPNKVKPSPKEDELKALKNEFKKTTNEEFTEEEFSLETLSDDSEKFFDKLNSKAETKKVKRLSKKEKEKVYEFHLKFVPQLAKKYIDKDSSFDDLVKEGSLGLRKAVEKFDPAEGYKFSDYAYWWIRQGITRAIDAQSLKPNPVKSDSKADQLISEADALKKYAELKDQGIITEEEFSAKKKQILGL